MRIFLRFEGWSFVRCKEAINAALVSGACTRVSSRGCGSCTRGCSTTIFWRFSEVCSSAIVGRVSGGRRSSAGAAWWNSEWLLSLGWTWNVFEWSMFAQQKWQCGCESFKVRLQCGDRNFEDIRRKNIIAKIWYVDGYDGSYYGTEAEIQLLLKRSSRFQRLFPNPSWLVWGRASRHQKLAPTFPGIDSCLMVTKRDFSKWKRHYD